MSLLTNKEKSLLAAYREKLWLERQIEQLEQDEKTEKELEELTIPPEATDLHVEESISEYKRHIDNLRANLDMLYQFNKSKELLQEKIYTQHFVTETLYPKPTDHQQTKLIEHTQAKIAKRDELMLELVTLVSKLSEKKDELQNVHRKIISQHIANKQLQADLREERAEHSIAKEQLGGAVKSQQVNDSLRLEASIIRNMLGVSEGKRASFLSFKNREKIG
ncbi:hypothetical protein EDC96DRAFT_118548 [Choanephora cucurbitarum]|nr:hypothetical protein EDC96DRAFT_118548 [Choanephora cucurbitarum]